MTARPLGPIILLIFGLMLAWHAESDAANRHRQPIICPPGYSAPADCTNQPEGENR